MRMCKRSLAMFMTFLLMFTMVPFAAFASEDSMINITSDWKGSVFGDVGGQDKITSENFNITENGDGTVTLRSSNNRGKIATGSSPSEGIAYYFKDIPSGADFELSATATIDQWTANNQVSFGIMLRKAVAENVSVTEATYQGNYMAVGAIDQAIKGFHRDTSTTTTKINFSADAPASGNEYDLSIKKSGSSYVLKVGDEIQTIENFPVDIAYAGLFTSRNTTVTFSNVNLFIEPKIDLGEWKFSAFGSDTSSTKNPAPTIGPDGAVTISASGGKIDSNNEGISYYYKEIPADANFEIYAKAKVNTFNSNAGKNNPSQKSFGLMIKDDINVGTSNFAAVGVLDLEMKGFYKKTNLQKNHLKNNFSDIAPPSADQEYDLKIKKSGDAYEVTINGKTENIVLDDLLTGNNYAGLFVARDADITFSNIDIKVDPKVPGSITADASAMKTQYILGESLDLTGLSVTATVYGNEIELTPLDFIVTGFDSSSAGTNTITVHYNGATTTVDLDVFALTVTNLDIQYYPAKTTYYLEDLFDPLGLEIVAEYNNGYKTETLTSDKYSFSIDDATVTGDTYRFTTPGAKTVTVISTETSSMTASFDVFVKEAAITGLEVRQQPQKTLYFIGEAADLSGLVLYAHYSDDTSVRLMNGEYTVSSLDTTTPGVKQIVITHKGQTATIDVTVKEREFTGIEVTEYPKTTYAIGEAFSAEGMVVSKVYDNEDKEPLNSADYTIDTSGFDNSAAGVYGILIVPADTAVEAITLNVTVREAADYVWNSMRFGQSTSQSKNTITVNDDGSVQLVAADGGGKITGDHDGISFYYVELDAEQDNFVLSADIKVTEYAKNPHDGQESFGIMARDAIGTHGDSGIFSSNIAAIGGYSGGTRETNGTQLFVRTGVTSPDGAGSNGIKKIMLHNEKPAADNTPYKLTLAKTNSGFTGKINDGAEQIIYEPDILNVQDGKMYVGFYTARVATIEVSNIQLTVSDAATDAPRVEPPKPPVTPSFDFVGLDKTSSVDYILRIKANVDGTVNVNQGMTAIAQDAAVQAGEILEIPAILAPNGKTNFSVSFLPDDTQDLTSYDRVVKNFSVEMKTYVPDGDIYVSTDGTSAGTGTQDDPIDLDTAIDFVRPGQKIIVLGGHYIRNSKLDIKKFNDGTAEARKYLVAAPGTRPVIDFDKKSEGVVLSGNYWKVEGLDFARSAGNTKGFTIGGSYNIVENSRFYEHGDTGLQISRTDDSDDKSTWPSHNLILNNTSFDNRDPSDNNADGFAAKLTSGEGNIFRGNIAHNNIDDGWDLYTKAGSGAIGAVIIENSIAYNNGTLTNGAVGEGDKNGFKLGGEGIHVPHIIRNSIAFGNGANGFTSNSNPGVIAENNIAFNNAGGNLEFSTYTGIPTDFTLNGFVSYQKDYTAKDNYPDELKSVNNYLFDGTESVNSIGVKLQDSNFASLTPTLPFERDEEGNIILGDFLRFIPPVIEEEDDRDDDTDSGGGHLNTGSGNTGTNPVNNPAPEPENPVSTVTVEVTVNNGVAGAAIDNSKFSEIWSNAATDPDGVKQVQITVPEADGANAYALAIPASAVSTGGRNERIAVNTAIATVVVPGNMLNNANLDGGQLVEMKVAGADASTLPDDVQTQIGDRPVVEFSVSADGQNVAYNNPDAPVTVSIPYQPTAQELADPEHITVWHVDGAGNVTPVPNAKYDESTGTVTFTTIHFDGKYAVAFVQKSFDDLTDVPWAEKQIEVMASKGVVNGTSATTFEPGQSITKADFTVLLVRALGLTANADSNFSDVDPADYYYSEVAVAKQLGIVNGEEEGEFRPDANMTRQEMFVMAARAMRAANKLKASGDVSVLNGFADQSSVADYATSDLAALVEAGLIEGDDGKRLNPDVDTTRAEAAVLIYRMYNL